MPGGDRTGSRVGSPKMGMGLDYCAENDQPGNGASQTGQSLDRGYRQSSHGRMVASKAARPDGYCICPDCGHKIDYVAGKPCSQQKCPKCGTHMGLEIHPW